MKNNRVRDGYEVTRASYIAEAGVEYFIALMIGGNFLAYLTKYLNVSDELTGIISAFATFACLAQVSALFFYGRRVKRGVIALQILNQLCFLFLYAVPLVDLPKEAKPFIFMVLMMAGQLISYIAFPLKMNWLMSAVPDRQRGTFTATKEIVSLVGGMVFTILFGYIADTYSEAGNIRGFFVVGFCALTVLMLLHTATLILCREKPAPVVTSAQTESPLRRARSILQNGTVMKVVFVGVFWNIASQFSLHFFASYQQNELAFTMTTITVIAAVGSISRVAVSRLLGRYADRRSFARMLMLCYMIAAVAFFINAFTSPGLPRWLYVVYLCLYSMALGGINSAGINLIFDYVAHEERAAALGVKNALAGVLGFLSTVLGSALFTVIREGNITLFSVRIYPQQILSLCSAGMIVLLYFYIRCVIVKLKRPGENDAKIA